MIFGIELNVRFCMPMPLAPAPGTPCATVNCIHPAIIYDNKLSQPIKCEEGSCKGNQSIVATHWLQDINSQLLLGKISKNIKWDQQYPYKPPKTLGESYLPGSSLGVLMQAPGVRWSSPSHAGGPSGLHPVESVNPHDRATAWIETSIFECRSWRFAPLLPIKLYQLKNLEVSNEFPHDV